MSLTKSCLLSSSVGAFWMEANIARSLQHVRVRVRVGVRVSVQTPVATHMPSLHRAPMASNMARISAMPTPGCRKPQGWRLRWALKAVPQLLRPARRSYSSWERQPQDREARVKTRHAWNV
jgi:hypothetical protein